VNEEGEVVEGGNMHTVNPAGFAIHSAVHKARPDVQAAVHCHSVPTKAFSALGCKLKPINQDACRYFWPNLPDPPLHLDHTATAPS
jgi:ribulose-5-phosphate 4-epimerase/fuculose-1-phosphate aldolase